MTTETDTALHGLRVLDFSDDIAGQYCARLLADYGADVVLVEPPGGSSLRRAAPMADESLLFFHLNHGKRSMLLDTGTADGRTTLQRLLARTDIVIAPPWRERADANPGCIHGRVSPFGRTGPWAEWRGCELVYQALSGVMMHNGEPGREPLYGCGHRASFAAGTALYIGLLAAVLARRAGAPGQDVEVSVAETAASMTTASTAFAYSGAQEGRNAGEHQLRCRDGWIGIWIYSHLWAGFCEALGLSELRLDPRFAHADDRQRNWAELMRLAQEAVAGECADDVVARLQAERVIAAKAATLTELAGRHPHLTARGFWKEVTTPDGPRRVLGPPFRMAASPRRLRGGAPVLGA